MVALIARYHRGDVPSERKNGVSELSSKQFRCVKVLSAIVRLVEDLDREHSQRISRVKLTVRGKKLILQLPPSKSLLVERWGLENHRSPLEEALRVGIEVR
jgi:exopolyphosphatase/guanosine-5'-triphosphate,3'-diphosphate pyrophosphatase